MKTCVRCGLAKELDAFYKRASAKDGRASYCKDCQRLYLANWKHANPDKVHAGWTRYYAAHAQAHLSKNRRWREAHRDAFKETIKRWERAHPDKVAAKYKRYRLSHPEKFKRWQDERRTSGRRRLANLTRRARLAAATIPGAPVTRQIIAGRFDVHGWRCYYCGRPLTPGTAVAEHRIPLSRGGLHCGANIVPACQACNFAKGERTEAEYRALGARGAQRPRLRRRRASSGEKGG